MKQFPLAKHTGATRTVSWEPFLSVRTYVTVKRSASYTEIKRASNQCKALFIILCTPYPLIRRLMEVEGLSK